MLLMVVVCFTSLMDAYVFFHELEKLTQKFPLQLTTDCTGCKKEEEVSDEICSDVMFNSTGQ